jgi:hypothetical protein
MSRFRVTVSSRFDELWRYNIIAVCELCSADGERIEYKSHESSIAPVGSNLSAPPADYDTKRTIKIESENGDYINILIYIVPHTLPTTNDIIKTKPFHLSVKVTANGEEIINRLFDINQWSGDNISLEKIGLN